MEKPSKKKSEKTAVKTISKKQQPVIKNQKARASQLNSTIKDSGPKVTATSTLNNPTNTQKPSEITTSVLLVEDHHVATRIAKNVLASLNCHIEFASNGKAALELIKNHDFDLVLMDIGLPDMNGYEVSQHIRTHELSKSTHVPIIALTAHGDSEHYQLCLDAGMNAMITKPLCKQQASEILATFVPSHQKWFEYQKPYQNIDENILNLKEKIVDFDYAKALLGANETAIYEILKALIQSLPQEVTNLQKAYQQGNWKTIGAIAHKLKSGASYCGALRLKFVSARLYDYVEAGATLLQNELYQGLLSEIEVLQKFMAESKSSASIS